MDSQIHRETPSTVMVWMPTVTTTGQPLEEMFQTVQGLLLIVARSGFSNLVNANVFSVLSNSIFLFMNRPLSVHVILYCIRPEKFLKQI